MTNNLKRTTVHDVAKKAGVSTATVSRVINDNDAVSYELKAQVQKVIDELGYRPNKAAHHLRSGKVKRVGVLFADIRNPFFTSVLAGIENSLHEAGYALILGNSNEDAKIENMQLQAFLDEGVAGIILSAVTNSGSPYQQVLDAGIPILAIDRIPGNLKVDSISIDNVTAAKQAALHLINLGHQKIAFIGGPEHISTAHLRKKGYLEALEEHPSRQPIIELGDFRQSGGYQATKNILAAHDDISAFLVANNLMTLGALQAFNEKKILIPEQIALVGFDDMPWATSLQPPLTVVAQPTYDMGKIAARLLLDRIKNPDSPIQQVILETQLIIRESCGGLRTA
ncbi:MAG TPA: LacI family DNA-binding transcriptional regulator [Anaerolineaceae bacterium]|nr:LacI family DNA-binding transcriptional regulator [Anaerolineaceae bacterium]